MHELSITQNILDLALQKAEEAKAKEIKKINLVIGTMTGVVEDCVRFYFELLSKGTPAEKTTLAFNMVSPRAKCRACGKSFELKEDDLTCPFCHSNSLELTAGKELFVESIEVE